MAYTTLCEIMERHGSDKGSRNISHHNYTKLYYELFKNRISDVLRIFELGLGTNNTKLPSNMGENGVPGASLRGWAEFFPNSSIYGADIDREILFNTDRITTFYCDQTNPQSITDMWDNDCLKEGFDIIVEDGLHEFDANVCFFENSIHKLKKGGIFIIEDIKITDVNRMAEMCKEWNRKFPEIKADVLLIQNECNHFDNNIVIIKS
jgi:hypothetical protein